MVFVVVFGFMLPETTMAVTVFATTRGLPASPFRESHSGEQRSLTSGHRGISHTRDRILSGSRIHLGQATFAVQSRAVACTVSDCRQTRQFTECVDTSVRQILGSHVVVPG